ncbi:MAG: arsenate reductase ArsC [Acidobacteriota bacterium]|jgi:arsenate reductase
MKAKKRVLILCTGNSCRSQMAEGWINSKLGESWEAKSAGTEPAEIVHPMAVRVMQEAGVDISGGRPENLRSFLGQTWDLVVTVCDSAKQTCPVFPRSAETAHVSFADPAMAEGTEEQRMTVFREIRDQIRERLLPLLTG